MKYILIGIGLLIGLFADAQSLPRQRNSTTGFDWGSGSFRTVLVPPRDTSIKPAIYDTGSIASIRIGDKFVLATWNGSKWDTAASGGGGGLDTVAADQVTILGNGVTPLTAPGIEARFNNIAALRAVSTTLTANTFVQTNGFYAPNDGGGSRYLILSSAPSGLPVDSISVIPLTGGRYARIVHAGTILWRQFGMKGDNTTNDYPGWKKMFDYLRVDRSVAHAIGTNGDRNRMWMTSAYNDDAFTIVNFSGIDIDGNGAKIIYDNNRTQSYVYHTIGGVKGIYRAKQSHVSSGGSVPNKTLYWGEYNWQLVQDNVVTSGVYPTWSASSVQYYGAHHFAVIGTETQTYSANPSIPVVSGVTFQNIEVTCEEPDNLTAAIGYWNIREKGFFLQDGIDNITIRNIRGHNILSEIIYGNGLLNVQRINIVNSELYNGSNGISSTGQLTVESNTIHHIAANAYESTPLTFKQTLRNNTIYNCENGITVGGAGDDINPFGDAIVQGNRIYNCTNYGVYLTRRVRGVKVINNTIYDVQYGVGIVASTVTFADAVSDIDVSGNTIGAYHYNGGYGIYLSAEHTNDTMRVSNVTIANNKFDQIEAGKIEGLNNMLGVSIFVYGDKFKNLTIRDNTDLFPLSVQFIQRDATAAAVNINTINNSKVGWSETNASRSNLLQAGGVIDPTNSVFQAQTPVTVNNFGGTPEISLNAYSAGANQRIWNFKPANDGTMHFGMMNDAGTVTDYMTVGRSGSTYANVIFPIGATLAGAYFQTDALGGSTNLADVGYGSARGFRVGANSGFDGPAFMLFGGEYSGLPGQMYFDYGSTARTIAGRKAVWRSASTGMAYDVMSLDAAGALFLNNGAGGGLRMMTIDNDGKVGYQAIPSGGVGEVTQAALNDTSAAIRALSTAFAIGNRLYEENNVINVKDSLNIDTLYSGAIVMTKHLSGRMGATVGVSSFAMGTGYTVSVATGSNDIGGEITLVTGSSSVPGGAINNIVSIAFTTVYSTTPFATFSAKNAETVALQCFISNSASGLSLSSTTTAAANTTYKWSYHVTQ